VGALDARGDELVMCRERIARLAVVTSAEGAPRTLRRRLSGRERRAALDFLDRGHDGAGLRGAGTALRVRRRRQDHESKGQNCYEGRIPPHYGRKLP